jgi:hypothetical protein
MRTTNISPEYNYVSVNGTLSMLEKKSFFGSKAIKIDDSLDIDGINIIYYQNSNNEQLSLSIESILDPIIYDIINDKLINSSLILDDSQTSAQKNANTRWILKINYISLLNNYLFAILKKYRTFEGVQNNMVISNDINSAINEYITNNLLSRYQIDHIDLFISYNDLSNSGLRFQNNWDQKVELDSNILNSFSKNTDSGDLEITFTQTQPSSSYSFNYYYNLYFSKI